MSTLIERLEQANKELNGAAKHHATIKEAIAALSRPAIAPQGEVVAELRHLYRAYVVLLESGRDRIRFLGGECDPVDVMERNDPALIQVRRFLATPQATPVAVEVIAHIAYDFLLAAGYDMDSAPLNKIKAAALAAPAVEFDHEAARRHGGEP